MPQFRLQAISKAGKQIKTEFEAHNKKEAKKKVDLLAQKRGFDVKSIDMKQTFMYKAKRNGKPRS
jgi:type IV pilus assembly protein PilC